MASTPPSDYIVFVRPEPADGAVRREVVGVIRLATLSTMPFTVNPDTGAMYLASIGYVKMYSAADLNFDAELCEELVALWTQCEDYRRTGDCVSEGYSEFLRRFGPACERADYMAHAALTTNH